MAREIKFRGRLFENGEFIYGYLDVNPLSGGGCSIISYDGIRRYVCDVVPETVGQFTGLHDRNGKEIYEGDIYAGKNKVPFVVKWNYHHLSALMRYATEVEVIGNIHQNPELLEVKE